MHGETVKFYTELCCMKRITLNNEITLDFGLNIYLSLRHVKNLLLQ